MNQKYQNSTTSLLFEEFKFVTDASLGRLAKWLRLLGYDTVVFPKEAGREMLRLAAAENRIVLTRRQDMTERQFSGCLFLIKNVDIGNQLNDVIDKYSLKIEKQKMFGICLECNEKLYPVGKEAVRDLVPPFVFENCAQYNQCPCCHKIYWMGTHQRNALEFMKTHIPCHLP
ncbi:MAG: Mut7-C RNAse domain-containing protein [Deltaproteobacteria bacterium]|nr:Mut7-C RNAse domain-containing protein [Deltaproteobacteria bacterium]